MNLQPSSVAPWVTLTRLAMSQGGVFHRDQALLAGVSSDALHRAVRSGKIVRVLPQVYRLAGVPDTWLQRVWAVCLWGGGACAASHRCAGAIWKLDGCPAEQIEVTTKKRRPAAATFLTHANPLTTADRTTVKGLPVTTPTRTLVDIAAYLAGERLELALEDALRRGLTSIPRLQWQLQRDGGPGRDGAGQLRNLLSERGEQTPTDSALETRFARWIRSSRLPQPLRQHQVHEAGRPIYRLDFAYPHKMLAIEIDSFRFHSGRRQWYRDRKRAEHLERMGWAVVFVAKEDLDSRSNELEHTIAAGLGIALF